MKISMDEQVLCCPEDCLSVYREYMESHNINFREETDEDGEKCFVLPRKYRPRAWKLEFE